MERVYLDYAANSPLTPEVLKAIEQFTHKPPLGNPLSLHTDGRKVQHLLDKAHTTVAAVFGVHPTEVVFTSGATESNNTVLRGVLDYWTLMHEGKTPHVVMTDIEHPSWRTAVQAIGTDVTTVSVSKDGVVKTEDILAAIKPNTALVATMYVNNEIGTVQPIAAIGKGIEALKKKTNSPWPVFHVDAVQAFPYLNTHSGHMHADTVTISGHKYGALGGSGALLIKKGTPIRSFIKGGSQEWGYRAGTENVLGAITLATAVDYADTHRETLTTHVEGLQSYLEAELLKFGQSVQVLGAKGARAPHITYLWLPGVIDEQLVHKLDLAGFSVSSGSACSSGARLPSNTLLSLGFSHKEAFGGVRVSYGRFTTKDELKCFLAALKNHLK